EVAALDVQSADSLVARHPVREFDSVVGSINTLLERQTQALHRERRLASAIAHELRTPLTAIVLQVQALEANPVFQTQSAVLARIRSDTLRAGHVLNQLLALARSSRGDSRAISQAVDIAELARTIAADYAQAAWERGTFIEVQASAPVCISGQPVLLDMAVRNLVENALRHTPPETHISIQCGEDPGEERCSAWLQVCDDGQRASASNEVVPVDSLHLGHEIVTRVADAHRATFSKTSARAPYTTCYRLNFPAEAPDPPG
ncbi:MAG: sensor histidine kinase, partial [Giesbergeria sp.]